MDLLTAGLLDVVDDLDRAWLEETVADHEGGDRGVVAVDPHHAVVVHAVLRQVQVVLKQTQAVALANLNNKQE